MVSRIIIIFFIFLSGCGSIVCNECKEKLCFNKSDKSRVIEDAGIIINDKWYCNQCLKEILRKSKPDLQTMEGMRELRKDILDMPVN